MLFDLRLVAGVLSGLSLVYTFYYLDLENLRFFLVKIGRDFCHLCWITALGIASLSKKCVCLERRVRNWVRLMAPALLTICICTYCLSGRDKLGIWCEMAGGAIYIM